MICFGAHKSPPIFPNLTLIIPVHLNIILPYILGSSKWSLSLLSYRNPVCTHLSSSPHVTPALPLSLFVISSPESFSDLKAATSNVVRMCMTGCRRTYLGLRYNSSDHWTRKLHKQEQYCSYSSTVFGGG